MPLLQEKVSAAGEQMVIEVPSGGYYAMTAQGAGGEFETCEVATSLGWVHEVCQP
jgi:hypothetical protein